MTDKPEILRSGRFELVRAGDKYYLWGEDDTQGIPRKLGPASWSEFYQFAQRIFQHEDSYKHDIERNAAIDYQRER